MCNCKDPGKDGTTNHVGGEVKLVWIKNLREEWDWIGRIIVSCENHAQTYLSTGFLAELKECQHSN